MTNDTATEQTCDAPSPGGGLLCVLEPHHKCGHVWIGIDDGLEDSRC